MTDTATPTPSASPQSAPPPADTGLFGLPASTDPNAKAKTTKTPADKFGLGLWGQATVNTQGLFNLAPGHDTADDAMQAFLQGSNNSATTAIVAAIQHAMYLAGYYTANYTPVSGLVRPQDQTAFAKFLIQNAQSTASTPNVADKLPLAQQLQDAASRGVAVGTAVLRPVTPKTFTVPAVDDLNAAADAAAQSVVGRNANAAEKKMFAAYYDKMILNFQKTQYADSQPVYPNVPAQPLQGGPNDGNVPGGSVYNSQVPLGAGQQPGTQPPGYPENMDPGQDNPTNQGLGVPLMTPSDFASHISDITTAANDSQTALANIQNQAVPTHILEDAANPSEAAAAWFKEHNPGEAQANSMNSAMGTFLQVISNGMMK